PLLSPDGPACELYLCTLNEPRFSSRNIGNAVAFYNRIIEARTSARGIATSNPRRRGGETFVRVGARGYCKIQKPPERYGIINVPELSRLCGFAQIAQLQQAQRQWIAEGLRQTPARDDRWSEGLAVVSSGFVAKIKKELGARGRQVRQTDRTFTVREQEEAYSDVFSTENDALSLDNRRFWVWFEAPPTCRASLDQSRS